MRNFLTQFVTDESGAVTVDWVVLTAAIVGLGIAVITIIGDATLDATTGLGAGVDGVQVTDADYWNGS